jgi:hypothetical protein
MDQLVGDDLESPPVPSAGAAACGLDPPFRRQATLRRASNRVFPGEPSLPAIGGTTRQTDDGIDVGK